MPPPRPDQRRPGLRIFRTIALGSPAGFSGGNAGRGGVGSSFASTVLMGRRRGDSGKRSAAIASRRNAVNAARSSSSKSIVAIPCEHMSRRYGGRLFSRRRRGTSEHLAVLIHVDTGRAGQSWSISIASATTGAAAFLTAIRPSSDGGPISDFPERHITRQRS